MSRIKRLLEIIWHGLDNNETDLVISKKIRETFHKVSEQSAQDMIRVQRKLRDL